MNKVVAWIKIVRPAIVFISFFGASTGFLNVTIGTGQSWTLDHTLSLIIMVLGAGLLGAGLMVHNDYTDLESDRINRPKKVLCQGIISPVTARWAGLIMMGLSVVFAVLTTIPLTGSVNWLLGVFTFLLVIIGIWYNRVGKLNGILGHASVALGVGAIPLWGAWAARPGMDEWMLMVPLALAVGTQEIGREIMVCIGDLKGDKEAGWKTTPVRWGRKSSLIIALVFYVMSLPLFLFAYFLVDFYPSTGFGYVYLAGAAVFWLVLIITWLDVVRVVRTGDEKAIWNTFERDIRTGTRVAVVAFQVVLIVEAFV